MPIEREGPDLPPGEWLEPAHRLISSAPDAGDSDLGEAERAWEGEIRRRLDEYRSGAVRPVPASEVFARARERTR